MTQLTRMGIDLAKHVFQLHGVDERGHTVLRRRISRAQLRAVMRQLARRTDATSRWVLALKARRGFNKAVVALAAKPARVLWALLATGRPYAACL